MLRYKTLLNLYPSIKITYLSIKKMVRNEEETKKKRRRSEEIPFFKSYNNHDPPFCIG